MQEDSSETALHLASKLGFKDHVKILLKREASVTLKDSGGRTPLYLAASNGNYEITKMLVATPDCDLHTVNKASNSMCVLCV